METEQQNENIINEQETLKRKRGRPKKIFVDTTNSSSSSDESVRPDSDNSTSDESKIDYVKRKPGRPKLYSEEELKQRISERQKKYYKTEEFKEYIKVYREKYVNETLPLKKLENGKFRCLKCKSSLKCQKDFYIHEKSKRHIESLIYF